VCKFSFASLMNCAGGVLTGVDLLSGPICLPSFIRLFICTPSLRGSHDHAPTPPARHRRDAVATTWRAGNAMCSSI